jgi:hypothetical protein
LFDLLRLRRLDGGSGFVHRARHLFHEHCQATPVRSAPDDLQLMAHDEDLDVRCLILSNRASSEAEERRSTK